MQLLLKYFANENNVVKVFCCYTLACLSLLLLPMESYAAGDVISNAMCSGINLITGGVGRAIATIIIISLAISLFLGKVSWGVALTTMVGMGMLFGANTIINLINGVGNTAC